MKMKDVVFSGWLPHILKATKTTGALRTLLQEEFEKDTKMEDLPRESVENKRLKVFVTAAEVDRQVPDLQLLRNYPPAAKIAAKEWCEMWDRVNGISKDEKDKVINQANKAEQLMVRSNRLWRIFELK